MAALNGRFFECETIDCCGRGSNGSPSRSFSRNSAKSATHLKDRVAQKSESKLLPGRELMRENPPGNDVTPDV
jgi:hypothetical protein